MSAMMGHNGVAQFDQQQNFMGDHFGADALMGMMGGQGFMADASMGGMAMDGSMLMPFIMANGNAALQMPPNGISSGEPLIVSQTTTALALALRELTTSSCR